MYIAAAVQIVIRITIINNPCFNEANIVYRYCNEIDKYIFFIR